MTLLAFLLIGGCLLVANFLNSVLDKRAARRLRGPDRRGRRR